ncbi:MAG TPA: glycosyltransferase family 2 protein [Candidatus Enterenecus faecium]|uniref:Glycosyltransferase family 2 protein n=1 Tax=Candidatus Enterenecus faecium TaxID=2840780 RepID=A0A9D1CGI1_9FIRM|nr:glycosyltransferase family 2 protein [Candidatus Enterenecus faecium]
MMITVVVPCYNEEQALPYFIPEIQQVAKTLETQYQVALEVLLVNDGSKDGTLSLMRTYAGQYKNVRYLSFSRNFGKEAAIYAGLEHAKGDYVAIMDADMQDPPALLPQMYEILRDEPYDSVATRRVDRAGEPPIRSFFARTFYKLINRISDADIVDGARDYRLMKRAMVDAILSMKEYNRFSKGIFGWVGFRTKWLPYENVQRVAGETKWSFWKLFLYSIEGIVAFSTAPLAMASVFGIITCLCAALALCFILVRTILFGDPVEGWPSMMCVMLFLGGIQLLSIGVIGQYLAKTYLETKHRPIYILQESSDGTKKDEGVQS